MVWNTFMDPDIVEDSGHSKESPVFDLLFQVCTKKINGVKALLDPRKVHSKNPTGTTGEWLI